MSSNIFKLKEEVEGLDEKLKEFNKEQEKAVALLQKKCKHPHEFLRECEYKKCDYVPSFPPMRVCLICGTWEEGWGCGYQTLVNRSKKAVPIIPREELYEYRRGKKIGD